MYIPFQCSSGANNPDAQINFKNQVPQDPPNKRNPYLCIQLPPVPQRGLQEISATQFFPEPDNNEAQPRVRFDIKAKQWDPVPHRPVRPEQNIQVGRPIIAKIDAVQTSSAPVVAAGNVREVISNLQTDNHKDTKPGPSVFFHPETSTGSA